MGELIHFPGSEGATRHRSRSMDYVPLALPQSIYPESARATVLFSRTSPPYTLSTVENGQSLAVNPEDVMKALRHGLTVELRPQELIPQDVVSVVYIGKTLDVPRRDFQKHEVFKFTSNRQWQQVEQPIAVVFD